MANVAIQLVKQFDEVCNNYENEILSFLIGAVAGMAILMSQLDATFYFN